MFGIKKKKTEDNITMTSTADTSKFQVHTMEDDINQIKGGGDKTNQQKTNQTQSPFFDGKSPTPSPTPTPTEKVAVPQQSAGADNATTQDNPFFAKSAKETATPPVDLPTPKDPPKIEISDKGMEINSQSLSKEIKIDGGESVSKSPVNDIEAEIASFAGKENSQTVESDGKITTFSPLTQTPKEMFEEMGGEDKNAKKTKSKSKSSGGLKKILKLLVSLFLLALLGIGAYFGYMYFKSQDTLSLEDNPINDLINQDQDQELTDTTEEDIDDTQMKKFALEFPNYIELTDELDSSEQFSLKLSEIAQSLPEQNTTAPISFLITDPNGTPLTLNSFAKITKMQLPQAVLDQAGDAFEIYAYQESGNTRFGIGFDYITRQDMSDALSDNELSLPDAFTPLYNTTQTIQPGVFADNVYGNYAVRFSNLLPDESVSIDYTVADKVYVGTSKNSQRAILDKYATDDFQN